MEPTISDLHAQYTHERRLEGERLRNERIEWSGKQLNEAINRRLRVWSVEWWNARGYDVVFDRQYVVATKRSS